jgi:Amt family ammonium transporter
MLGGCSALAGARVIGPRLGRYGREGALAPIPAHNLPLALAGSFLMTIGWIGLNVATLSETAGRTAAVTILAGAAGAVMAVGYMVVTTRKPDPTITMNGLLAGLVASSAASNCIGPTAAVAIGAVAGVLVGVAVRLFDKNRIDDPVGAISVHGVGGLWGVLAVGIFANSDSVKGCLHGNWSQLGVQMVGALVLAAWAFGVSWIFFKVIGQMIPLRVPPEVELEGLDISETGLVAYPEFQRTNFFGGGFTHSGPRRDPK